MKTISCESPEDFRRTGYPSATRQISGTVRSGDETVTFLLTRANDERRNRVERADDPRLVRDVRVARSRDPPTCDLSDRTSVSTSDWSDLEKASSRRCVSASCRIEWWTYRAEKQRVAASDGTDFSSRCSVVRKVTRQRQHTDDNRIYGRPAWSSTKMASSEIDDFLAGPLVTWVSLLARETLKCFVKDAQNRTIKLLKYISRFVYVTWYHIFFVTLVC